MEASSDNIVKNYVLLKPNAKQENLFDTKWKDILWIKTWYFNKTQMQFLFPMKNANPNLRNTLEIYKSQNQLHELIQLCLLFYK